MHNRKYLKEKRQELRNHGTSAEAFLWEYPQKKQLNGKKFRRQQSIENLIVDFYCPSEKLIVELDGDTHNNSIANQKDRLSDNHLEKLGFKIPRFENQMVSAITVCFKRDSR